MLGRKQAAGLAEEKRCASDASSFLSETLADASQSTSRAGMATHSTGSAGSTGLPE